MAAKRKPKKQHEVKHEIGDGFVVAWDTNVVSIDVRDDLREAASEQIERLGSDLISIEPKAAPRRRRRPVRPRAA